MDAIDGDIAKGQLYKLHTDPVATERLAFDLSHEHTARSLSRTLDILHVANALIGGLSTFITADRRQARLADAAGLEVELIKIPRQL